MTEPAARTDGVEYLSSALAQLQADGAQGFDPVRFQYLAAMIRRALALPEPAATVVADKARAALGRFHSDFHHARKQADDDLERLCAAAPASRETWQRRLQDGDFTGLRRAAAGLRNTGSTASPAVLTRLLAADPAVRQSTPGTLARAMAEQELDTLGQARDGASQAPTEWAELKSLAPLRHALATLATTQLLEAEQRATATDSGPLNPQLLALRSLQSMQALSPAYLDRFVSYLDALFWLEKHAAGYSPPKP